MVYTKFIWEGIYLLKDCVNDYLNGVKERFKARMTIAEYNLSYRDIDKFLDIKPQNVIEAERVLNERQEQRRFEKERRSLARKLKKTA